MYHGERLNSITHLAGGSLALAGLVVLIVFAGFTGDPWKIVSAAIYGTTLVVLYTFSTLYHSLRGRSKRVFRTLDHSAIYVLIAGTYTPFTLVTLRGPWGWSLFGIVWGLAALGVAQEVLFAKGARVISVTLYLLMGWLVLVAVRPISHSLPGAGLAWLTVGGLFYTAGVAFYASDKKIPHGHGIWHFFVLAGSISHYLAILLYVL